MEDIPLSLLFSLLFILILLSGFFSSSETGMMALNRYRLRHLAKQKHRGAMRAEALLKRPDRLIGVILTGNNLVNILAAVVASTIGQRLYGDAGIAAATFILTLVILVFSEVTPKTLAALHPEKIAFPAAFVLRPLLKIIYPVVWLVNTVANFVLRLFGVRVTDEKSQRISQEELRTVLHEAEALIPGRHQNMLLGILDLDQVTVEDIMIPRNEIQGLDLDDDLDEIVEQIRNSQHTRLPVYKGDINNIIGVLHLRNASQFLTDDNITKAAIMQVTRAPYFIPETTSLNQQLVHFQKEKRRIGLVVDEYGDVQGIATLEDILEEVIGEFTTDVAASSKDVHAQSDGSYIVDGTASLREINKTLNWALPTNGPKTINGLVVEHLESIPDAGVSFKIGQYYLETLQIRDNVIKTVKVIPAAPSPINDGVEVD